MNRRIFVEDAERGFAYIDLCRKRYDVILINPPFGEPAKDSKTYVEKHYLTKGDVLTNFVERTLELCQPDGLVGAITSRTPFYLGTQAAFRERVLQKAGFITCLADLGYGVLEAMVETAAYTLSLDRPPASQATFIRALLARDNQAKADLLLHSAERLHKGEPDEWIFQINPDEFARLPGSPYAYWVEAKAIQKLAQYPKLEGNSGSVKVGLQTGDDWRYLRSTWEVPSETLFAFTNKIVGSKENLLAETQSQIASGKKWALFSKTEKAYPWFSPIMLLVFWESDGAELKNFTDEKGKLRSRPQNLDFYFSPGFSYMLRSTRLVPYIVPAGVIPTAGRSQVYPIEGKEYALLGYCASNIASAVARFSGESFARPKYQASMVQNLPVPELSEYLVDRLKKKIEAELDLRRSLAQQYEPYQEFTRPALLGKPGENGADWNINTLLGSELEVEIAEAFGLSRTELAELEHDIREAVAIRGSSPTTNSDDTDEEVEEEATENDGGVKFIDQSPRSQYESLVSYAVGAAFGRWDVRIGMDDTLAPELPSAFDPLPVCPPGMLVGPDGRPAKPDGIASEEWLRARPDVITLPAIGTVQQAITPDKDYPIPVAWDGILVDDPEDAERDIVLRVHRVLEVLFGSQADEIEKQICQALDIAPAAGLRAYFRTRRGTIFGTIISNAIPRTAAKPPSTGCCNRPKAISEFGFTTTA